MNEIKLDESHPIKTQVISDVSQSKPMFSNYTNSFFSYESWLLDFIHNFDNQGVLVARIVITPSHMKNLAKLLNDQVKQYEEKFGVIKTEAL